MAVVLDISSGCENEGILKPQGPESSENWTVAASAVAERDKLASALWEERYQAARAKNLPRGKRHFGLPKNEVIFPRRPEHFPDEMQLLHGEGVLLDFKRLGGPMYGPMVSRRFREIVEKHEPAGNGFAFFPARICMPDGTLLSEDHFFFDVYRRVDAINPDSPDLYGGEPEEIRLGNHRWSTPRDYPPVRPDNLEQKRSVLREKIAGMAVWCDIRYDFPGSDLFLSDALFDDLQAAGLTGFRAYAFWAEV